ERPREAVREVERSGVEVRLEERHEPAAVAKCGEVGRELGRVVRIAVEADHTARLALWLKPAAGAAEFDDRGLGFLARHPRELERRERGRGVAPVVLARHGE